MGVAEFQMATQQSAQCKRLCGTSLSEEHPISTPEGSKHSPGGTAVPLAGGGTAFLRPGGGTFFSGSGFLGTTGTSKILFCKFSFMNTETTDSTIL